MQGRHRCYSNSASEQVLAGQNVSLRKKYKKKREVKRLSAIASEQLTPELSQGVLVARHVDRPWQVAWVHVAQPERLQICRQREGETHRATQKEKSVLF